MLKTVQGLTAVSGAAVIQVAFAILSSIAIDQFVAIESARPNLEAALTEAKQRVDLDVLATLDNGEDMLYFNWARAMDTTDPEDDQVLQLAAMAQVRAEQSGYAAPPKEYHLVPEIPADRLASGTTGGYLEQSKKLVSRNGKYEAEMQGDGNFVIYAANRQAIWATAHQREGHCPVQASDAGRRKPGGVMDPPPRSGPAASEPERSRSRSSCRTTAISSSTTTRCVRFGRAVRIAEVSAGRRLAWAAVRLFSRTDK